MPGKSRDNNYLIEHSPLRNNEVGHTIGLKESLSQKEEKTLDQKLWLKIRIGSQDAFKELFLKYNNVLVRYGKSIVQDSCLVEDCIHDLFLYIWSKRCSLSEVESVKYYLIVSFRRRIFRILGEKEKGQACSNRNTNYSYNRRSLGGNRNIRENGKVGNSGTGADVG